MRRFCLLLGLGCLAFIWLGPLLSVWRSSFAAHMLAHMGAVAVAAPLVGIGVSGWWPGRARAGTAALALPLIASLVELIVVWGWHAPALRALAETSTIITVIEQASFFLTGLLLWVFCIGAANAGRSVVQAAGIFSLFVTSIHMTLLGALLALSPRPLYGAEDVTCFGLVLNAQQDQEIGGVMMLVIGGVVYLAGGLTLLGKVLTDGSHMEKAAH